MENFSRIAFCLHFVVISRRRWRHTFAVLVLSRGSGVGKDGQGQPDRGMEDGCLLLSYNSGGPLLGDFSCDVGFLSKGSQSGFVLGS